MIGSTSSRCSSYCALTATAVAMMPYAGMPVSGNNSMVIRKMPSYRCTSNPVKLTNSITACAWGLVNRVLPPEELLPDCKQLAIDICSAEPITLKEVHHLIDYSSEFGLSEGLKKEALATVAHKKIGDVSADTLEVRRQRVLNMAERR